MRLPKNASPRPEREKKKLRKDNMLMVSACVIFLVGMRAYVEYPKIKAVPEKACYVIRFLNVRLIPGSEATYLEGERQTTDDRSSKVVTFEDRRPRA